MTQVRAIKEREEVYAVLQWMNELTPKPEENWVFANGTLEAEKHRTEWCVAGSTNRCMRGGRSSESMKIQGTREGPERPREGSNTFGKKKGHDIVRRVDRIGEDLIWCRKCSVYARQRLGPKWVSMQNLTNWTCEGVKVPAKKMDI